MNELKATSSGEIRARDALLGYWWYEKSEADKVIDELKAQKAQAEDDCAYWKMREGNAVNAMHETEEYAMQLYNGLCHQKYKRCLAMAEWCDAEADVADADGDYEDMRWFQKWHKRWLKIAEQFKVAK